MDALLSEKFCTRKLSLLSGPHAFMSCGDLGVDFFSTTEGLYPNLKSNSKPDSFNARLATTKRFIVGIGDSSFHTSPTSLRDSSHRTKTDVPAYTPVKFD